MNFQQLLFLLIWIAISFGTAYTLHKKTAVFKKMSGVIILFVLFIASILFHNAIFAFFQIKDAVFFILALLSLGTGVALSIIQLVKTVTYLVCVKRKK